MDCQVFSPKPFHTRKYYSLFWPNRTVYEWNITPHYTGTLLSLSKCFQNSWIANAEKNNTRKQSTNRKPTEIHQRPKTPCRSCRSNSNCTSWLAHASGIVRTPTGIPFRDRRWKRVIRTGKMKREKKGRERKKVSKRQRQTNKQKPRQQERKRHRARHPKTDTETKRR